MLFGRCVIGLEASGQSIFVGEAWYQKLSGDIWVGRVKESGVGSSMASIGVQPTAHGKFWWKNQRRNSKSSNVYKYLTTVVLKDVVVLRFIEIEFNEAKWNYLVTDDMGSGEDVFKRKVDIGDGIWGDERTILHSGG